MAEEEPKDERSEGARLLESLSQGLEQARANLDTALNANGAATSSFGVANVNHARVKLDVALVLLREALDKQERAERKADHQAENKRDSRMICLTIVIAVATGIQAITGGLYLYLQSRPPPAPVILCAPHPS